MDETLQGGYIISINLSLFKWIVCIPTDHSFISLLLSFTNVSSLLQPRKHMYTTTTLTSYHVGNTFYHVAKESLTFISMIVLGC